MLMFLCMADKLKERYDQRGIDESIYHHTMKDFCYKLDECRTIYGMDGLFTAFWTPVFFELRCFALGRLQFEIVKSKVEFTLDGVTYPVGTKAINMHIPRTGKGLDHDSVMESYRLAAEFFADEFVEAPVIFTCWSWLIAPWHLDVLAPESNMSKFIRDFKIAETGTYANYNNVWRVFDCRYTGDISVLPRKTTLQRAYVERIQRGDPYGWGRGFFLYRDGKIYNQ